MPLHPTRGASATTTWSRSARSCCGSIPARAASARARHFRVWEGGGEYNVARGLRRCFGLRTAVVTALADNDVGRLVEDLHPAGRRRHRRSSAGCRSTASVAPSATDSTSPSAASACAARVGVSDRGHTAAASMKPGDVDWEHLFGELGVRWLHTGGIFAALSETTADVVGGGR